MYRLYVYDPAFVLHRPGDGLAILDRESYADAKALYFGMRAEGKHADLYHVDEKGGLRLVSPAGEGVPHVPPTAEQRPYEWEPADAEPIITVPAGWEEMVDELSPPEFETAS